MFGIVVWVSADRSRALIACDEGRDLAIAMKPPAMVAANSRQDAVDTSAIYFEDWLEVGSQVEFQSVMSGRGRLALNLTNLPGPRNEMFLKQIGDLLRVEAMRQRSRAAAQRYWAENDELASESNVVPLARG